MTFLSLLLLVACYVWLWHSFRGGVIGDLAAWCVGVHEWVTTRRRRRGAIDHRWGWSRNTGIGSRPNPDSTGKTPPPPPPPVRGS